MTIEMHLTCEEAGQIKLAVSTRIRAVHILHAAAKAKGDYIAAGQHELSLETLGRVIDMIGMARQTPEGLEQEIANDN